MSQAVKSIVEAALEPWQTNENQSHFLFAAVRGAFLRHSAPSFFSRSMRQCTRLGSMGISIAFFANYAQGTARLQLPLQGKRCNVWDGNWTPSMANGGSIVSRAMIRAWRQRRSKCAISQNLLRRNLLRRRSKRLFSHCKKLISNSRSPILILIKYLAYLVPEISNPHQPCDALCHTAASAYLPHFSRL